MVSRFITASEMPCSVARSQAILGDRWTILILRNAFLAIRRFDVFQQQLGIPRHILSVRLKKLVEAGILNKVPYQTRPLRHEYRLTDMGKELYPVVLALVAWGDKWLSDADGTPVLLHHQTCGHFFTPVMTCSECGDVVTARDVTPVLGQPMLKWMQSPRADALHPDHSTDLAS
jgi:DNA-binding HxlR family transcriptional regulator